MHIKIFKKKHSIKVIGYQNHGKKLRKSLNMEESKTLESLMKKLSKSIRELTIFLKN